MRIRVLFLWGEFAAPFVFVRLDLCAFLLLKRTAKLQSHTASPKSHIKTRLGAGEERCTAEGTGYMAPVWRNAKVWAFWRWSEHCSVPPDLYTVREALCNWWLVQRKGLGDTEGMGKRRWMMSQIYQQTILHLFSRQGARHLAASCHPPALLSSLINVYHRAQHFHFPLPSSFQAIIPLRRSEWSS